MCTGNSERHDLCIFEVLKALSDLSISTTDVCSYIHRQQNQDNMYINQQDAQNSVIRLYFPLDAVHVSDYISPSSGATFISCTSHLVYAGTIRLAVARL